MKQKWAIIMVGIVAFLVEIGIGKPLEPDDLRHFHSALLYGIGKACPAASKNYKNMLKMVDQAVETKLEKLEIDQALLPGTSLLNDPKLHLILGSIRKCYKNIKVKTSPEESVAQVEQKNSGGHKYRNSAAMQRIRAYLDEEGRQLRRATQLDIIPNSENILKFEKLGIQLMASFCKMDDEIKTEHNRVGALLLSALNSKSDVPKATIHQKEMEELISETGDCLKLYTVEQ